MTDLTKIDLSEEALNLLLPQFKQAKKLKAVVEGSVAYLDANILNIDELLTSLEFDNLSGLTLDYIGKLLNVYREGREDSSYKIAIKTRIFINSSGGNAGSVLPILDRIVGLGGYRLIESFPAEVQVRLYKTQEVLDEQVISDILPIGVKGLFFQNPYEDKNVWTLSEVDPDGSIPSPDPLSVLPNVADVATSDVTLIDVIFT